MRPRLPDYGTFTHWPEDGHARIHPEDIAIVSRVIPSARVFRRTIFDGVFYRFTYGSQVSFRLRPCMWLPLNPEGFDVDDQVEVTGVGMARQLFVGRVVEMRFEKKNQRIEYTLEQSGNVLPQVYLAEQMRNLERKTKLRQSQP